MGKTENLTPQKIAGVKNADKNRKLFKSRNLSNIRNL